MAHPTVALQLMELYIVDNSSYSRLANMLLKSYSTVMLLQVYHTCVYVSAFTSYSIQLRCMIM